MQKSRVRIFSVPDRRYVPIKNVVTSSPQQGFFQLCPGEFVFKISLSPLKIEQIKFDVDLLGARIGITAEPGNIYVSARRQEDAVRRFLNRLSDEHAVRIANANGADIDLSDIHFPEEKNPDQ